MRSSALIFLGAGLIPALFPSILPAQETVINEVLSSNQGSIIDEDGDTPDWLEIYNRSTTTIDLEGYGLSDDLTDPFKWTFPATILSPGEHQLVFTSGKDRRPIPLSWEVVVNEGDVWRYTTGTNEPPSDWQTVGFDASGWNSGPAGIGYGDGDDQTIIPTTLSLYMRQTFSGSLLTDAVALAFHMDFDDGYVAFLNHIEIARENLGQTGEFIPHSRPADTYLEASLYQGINLPAHLVSTDLLLPGENVLAIQVHNNSISSSDLTAIPFLSIGRASGEIVLPPAYLLVPPGNELHTNFRISTAGEELGLTPPSGSEADIIMVPPLLADISYGRSPDGADLYVYFDSPTPGAENTGGYPYLALPPIVTPPPGFYNGSVSVNLNAQSPETQFHFTLDGSEPTTASPVYSQAFDFNTTSVLRVLSTRPGALNITQSAFTFFVDEDHQLPVISLIFEPGDFFDAETGIYATGSSASPEFPYFGANFWEDWERPLHFEYFAEDGSLDFTAPAGVKIFGGWSRGFGQKSLALFARSTYGAGEFAFPFFSDRDFERFEALVLRNSGNDWNYTGLRDGVLTGLGDAAGLETQAFDPVEVFLNGAYWGIYNLREKVNEHFAAARAGLTPDDIDLLEMDGVALHGSSAQYNTMLDFIATHDLATAENYEVVKDLIDIDNFIHYQLSQIYFDNRDWPGNNIKYWRPISQGGKWRWILYDTDFGFGIWNPDAYRDNTLNFAVDPAGPDWPNPPWSTFLLRNLLHNSEFTRNFILTACDLLNENFRPDRVQESISSKRNQISSAVSRHFTRWEHNNVSNWNYQIGVMNNFALYRPAFMRLHFKNYFGLGNSNQLTVAVTPPGSGNIRVHSIIPQEYPWSGHYFENLPIDVTALPAGGYRFSHWEGIDEDESSVELVLGSSREIVAVFEVHDEDDNAIVINEINYHSPDNQDAGDWLEIFNNGQEAVNLNGWYLSDHADDNIFTITDIQLGPGAYLVLCHDSSLVRSIHGTSFPAIGNFSFNLSNGGELARLFRYDGILIDSVRYDDESPWPTAADGDGSTLELIFPALDNGLAGNWAASDNLGTPGARNSRYQVPAGTDDQSQPDGFQVHSVYPNPFNARITIPVTLAQTADISLSVFDLRGRLIYTANYPQLPAGRHPLRWAAVDANGETVGAGSYFLQIRHGGNRYTRKAIYLK